MITPTTAKPEKRAHTPSEATIQQQCVSWLWNERPETRGLYFAVENEQTLSAALSPAMQKAMGSRRRMMGVVSGVSDTILLMPRGGYHALCVEFKTEKGKQSEHQKEWQDKVEKQCYYYCVIRSLEQFQEIINWYLKL